MSERDWRPYDPCRENEDAYAYQCMLDRHAISLARFLPQPATLSHHALSEILRERRGHRRIT